MINYSIVMRGVNTNLFEINQAKSRIKAAQKSGATPDPADTALVDTEVQRAFASAQYTDVMTIDKFARHIADHGCVYSRADIAAILNMAVDCMREQLLEGRKIRLGELGDFSLSLTSNGAESAEKFSAANITSIVVQWDCGPEFKNLLNDAEFNLVASRAAQAAVIKAIKAGQDIVDLTPESNGTTNQQPNGNNQQNTGNQYTLTLSAQPANGGTVTGGGSYAQGATATLKATPASGYAFTRWSDGNTQATRTLTVTESKTLTATFTADTPSGGGSTSGNGGTEEG